MTCWLVVTGDRNTKRNDFEGAFRPEAQRFALAMGVPSSNIVRIDLSKSMKARAQQVADAILRVKPARVAFFCHGTRRGIQLGFDLANVKALASLIAVRGLGKNDVVPDPEIVLYACSAAGSPQGAPGGDGGFADALRDALCGLGAKDCRVLAHDTVGHTSFNPHLVEFRGDGSPTGGNGGQWVVAPKSKLWPKWVKALRNTDLRYRMSILRTSEIHAILAG